MKNKKKIIIAVVSILLIAIIYFATKGTKAATPYLYGSQKPGGSSNNNQQGTAAGSTTAAPGYTQAQAIADAKRLWNAQGWIKDDASEVFAVIENKSRAQLDMIDEALIRIHDYSILQFTTRIFDKPWEQDDRRKALLIIQNAI